MYLICFGTRPELIKLIPLINLFKKNNIVFKTLFSGQHENLIENFYKYIDKPDIILNDIMEHNQSLNKLTSKIISKMDYIYQENNFTKIIIQGDTSTAYAISLSAFHNKLKIIHLEAGLRSNNKYSPYPEEMNRRMISQLADIHLCPTLISLNNLKKEDIIKNIYLVGNTIVDIYKYISENTNPNPEIKKIIETNKSYIIVTLHRRENRKNKIKYIWNQLNELSNNYKFVYITHPSINESKKILNDKIIKLDPLDYESMVHLITNCKGIISDSGGLQEEAVCSNKKILVCRDTTERQETINCGLGKLVDTNIINNIDFLFKDDINIQENPYGIEVCDKILNILYTI
jgi:UDP-N-acetylglucosamine 2-epimerase (non-hydrolysing)